MKTLRISGNIVLDGGHSRSPRRQEERKKIQCGFRQITLATCYASTARTVAGDIMFSGGRVSVILPVGCDVPN